jgi:hypothetical protein
LSFDETDDFFKIGAQGSTEIIATRPWATTTFAAANHNHTVDSLSNVLITSKTSGDVLKWNGTAWVNSAVTVSKSDVGLGNVDNTSDLNKPVSTATTTALALKAPLASPTFTGTVSGITKAMVGLGDVDNTSDAAKPVSTAQQTALDAKAPIASPTFTGTVSGITKAMVGLGSVDNTSDAAKPVSTATQSALDAKAPLASPTFTGTVAGITATMVGLGNVNNTADSAKPVSTAQQTALDLKANLASPTFTGVPVAPTAAAGTNTTQVATTAFVLANSVQQTTVNTVTGRVQDSDGNLRSIPFSNKTAAYTLVAADNGKNINITTGGITIPTNSVFAAGDVISIYNKSGTAQNVSWSGGTVYLMGTTTAKTSPLSLAGRGGLTIMFVTGGATPEILVSGNV